MKVLSKLTGILAFCGLLFVMSGWTSNLDMNNAAQISKDGPCLMYDGDGNLNVFTTVNISVITSSGHTTFICKAKDVQNSTGKAAILKGFLCNTYMGLTTDTKNTVSAAGVGTLRCRI